MPATELQLIEEEELQRERAEKEAKCVYRAAENLSNLRTIKDLHCDAQMRNSSTQYQHNSALPGQTNAHRLTDILSSSSANSTNPQSMVPRTFTASKAKQVNSAFQNQQRNMKRAVQSHNSEQSVLNSEKLVSLQPSNLMPNAAAKGESFIQKNFDCSICGDRANGVHYGAISCEGCKGFFRRAMLRETPHECQFEGQCNIRPTTRGKCAACRFAKCLSQGMSIGSIKLGRRSNKQKISLLNLTDKGTKRSVRINSGDDSNKEEIQPANCKNAQFDQVQKHNANAPPKPPVNVKYGQPIQFVALSPNHSSHDALQKNYSASLESEMGRISANTNMTRRTLDLEQYEYNFRRYMLSDCLGESLGQNEQINGAKSSILESPHGSGISIYAAPNDEHQFPMDDISVPLSNIFSRVNAAASGETHPLSDSEVFELRKQFWEILCTFMQVILYRLGNFITAFQSFKVLDDSVQFALFKNNWGISMVIALLYLVDGDASCINLGHGGLKVTFKEILTLFPMSTQENDFIVCILNFIKMLTLPKNNYAYYSLNIYLCMLCTAESDQLQFSSSVDQLRLVQKGFDDAERLFHELKYMPVEFSFLRQFRNWFETLLISARAFYQFRMPFKSVFFPVELYHGDSDLLMIAGSNNGSHSALEDDHISTSATNGTAGHELMAEWSSDMPHH